MSYSSNCRFFLRESKLGVISALSDKKKTLIGRALDCQIVLNAPQDVSISRYHAELLPPAKSELGEWEICDLHSNYGTYVNGQRIQERYILQTGDRLTFGESPTELIFQVQETPIASQKPKNSSSRWKSSQSSILSPSTWFPPRSKWRNLWQEGQLSSVVTYLILCVLAVFFSDINNNTGSIISNELIAALLLILSIEALYQKCGKRKPWWLILVISLITLVFTGIIIYQFIPLDIREDILKPDIRKISLKFILTIEAIKAPLKEAIKALPVMVIYSIGRKLSSALQKRIGVYDPLDGILLTVASAVGLVMVESSFLQLRLIITGILPNIAGDLAYSGVFGYYIGLSAIKSPRKRWKIIGIGYLFASSLHFILAIFPFILITLFPILSESSDEIKIILSIPEYLLLIACILKGRDQAKQT